MVLFKIVILIVYSFFQTDLDVGERIYPTLLKENLSLTKFHVSKSYKLSKQEYVLIAKEENATYKNEGHQLIFLVYDSTSNKYIKRFLSEPKGEAYVYNPYFFKFNNREIIIIAEEGFEYMSGIDVYILKNSSISFLGYVPVSGTLSGSVIENINIMNHKNDYTISFIGKIEYEAGSGNTIEGSNLSVNFDKEGMKIINK